MTRNPHHQKIVDRIQAGEPFRIREDKSSEYKFSPAPGPHATSAGYISEKPPVGLSRYLGAVSEFKQTRMRLYTVLMDQVLKFSVPYHHIKFIADEQEEKDR